MIAIQLLQIADKMTTITKSDTFSNVLKDVPQIILDTFKDNSIYANKCGSYPLHGQKIAISKKLNKLVSLCNDNGIDYYSISFALCDWFNYNDFN